MTGSYDVDVLVIGGGVNGLVVAGLLAGSGASVRLVERAPGFGGLAARRRGAAVPSGAIDVGRFRPDLAQRLQLERHGWNPAERAAQSLVGWSGPDQDLDNGPVDLRLFCDIERATDAVARRSRSDAEALPRFLAHVESLLPRFETLLRGPATVQSAAGLAADPELMRFVSASLDDLLRWWFRSDAVQAAFAGLALHASGLAPRDQGTGWLLLDQLVGSTAAALRAPCLQESGEDGAFVDALAAAARAAGARIQNGLGVQSLQVRSGRVQAVRLSGGDELRARLVISTLDTPSTLLGLVGARHLPVEVARQLGRLRIRGTTARWVPGGEGAKLDLPGIVVAESMDGMQRAADDAKRGRASTQPWAVRWGGCVDLHYLPYPLEGGSAGAPWSDLVAAGRLESPLERERAGGAAGGAEQGAWMSLDQLLVGRGVTGCVGSTTPIRGLLLGGAGSHPGGGVTGLPAAAASHEALRQLEKSRSTES